MPPVTPPEPPRGRFITFEGGEGAGKSTQITLLADALRARGLDILATREPGGSEGAESIRRLLVEGEVGRWDAVGEALLNSAARRDHLVNKIWPALKAGSWVVSDRFADSTLAYQGYGHGLPLPLVEQLYKIVADDFVPDLTLILDLPVSEGLARARQRGGSEDRYERMGRDFHERLRRGFLQIAERYPMRCAVISATGEIPEIRAAILEAVEKRLGLKTG